VKGGKDAWRVVTRVKKFGRRTFSSAPQKDAQSKHRGMNDGRHTSKRAATAQQERMHMKSGASTGHP
jgi:hypothetical protein